MSRPGEIRTALEAAARQLHAEQGAATWRDLAERACVGFLAARRTVENMARAGAIVPVGKAKRAHSRRWMTLYEPGSAGANFATAATAAADDLSGVMRRWSASSSGEVAR